MKKSKLLVLAGLGVALAAVAAKDPVLMRVAGLEVPLSEFEYLYNKNSRQQVEPQTLEEYAEVFKLYKQKVADALAAGKDTTAQFRQEYAQYRHELALPFMTDSAYIEQLAREEYSMMDTEAEAIHIMRFKSPHADDNRRSIQVLDSVLGLLAAGEDFAELARTYSQDKGSMNAGGKLGYIPAGKFPYKFEKAVFDTPEGKVTEIVETPMGYHIIKGGKKRPARGTVLTAHILKMVQNNNQNMNGLSLNSDEEARAKHTIDSLYNIIKANPVQFEALAVRYSDDKQSGRSGGRLPWFGVSEMVQEFDSVAFSQKPGEISAPFRTPYGWHIVKTIERAPVKSYEEMRPNLITIVTHRRDVRSEMIANHQFDLLQKEFKGKYNDKVLADARNYISRQGIDSLFAEKFFSPEDKTPVYTFNGGVVTVADVAPYVKAAQIIKDPEFASAEFEKRLKSGISVSLIDHKEDCLAEKEPEYRNLVREFHDGSLLYEIGKDRVWDRSSKDTEGLQTYFAAHKDDYKWKEPRAKGLLIQTTSDSISNIIRSRAAGLDNDSIINMVRKEFLADAKVERVLAPKGANPMVDYAVFGGEEVNPSNTKYKDFFVYNFRVLEAPEEVNDVRGLVTGDYQNYLEKEWEEELKSKYPVEVDPKVMKKVKISGRK